MVVQFFCCTLQQLVFALWAHIMRKAAAHHCDHLLSFSKKVGRSFCEFLFSLFGDNKLPEKKNLRLCSRLYFLMVKAAATMCPIRCIQVEPTVKPLYQDRYSSSTAQQQHFLLQKKEGNVALFLFVWLKLRRLLL